MAHRLLWACAVLLCVPDAIAYYLPGTYPQEFLQGQTLQAEVNSLTSSETELPYNYYTMPFCKPPEGIRKSLSSVNPGTIMMGTRIENSPYNFSMLVEEKAQTACKPENFYGPLTDREVADFREKIDQHYRVRLILDNLPVTTYDLAESPESVRPGFEVGAVEDGKYYVNNHLVFRILVHKTNGQYTRSRADMAELEAAAVVEGGTRRRLAAAGAGKASTMAAGVAGSAMRRLRAAGDEKSGGDKPGGPPRPPMYMVVGFEVMACSIARTAGERPKEVSCIDEEEGRAPARQEVTVGAKVVYTYDVYWDLSETSWASRWDAYLRMPGGRVHWFSILNSLMVVLVMSSICAMIMLRTIRRDLARYEGLLGETGPKDDLEESGWKMVSGDVFRPPANATLLAVQVGSGLQIISSAFITLLFAALGFLSPASRGALLTAMLVMYLLAALAAGFGSVALWGLMNRSYDGWPGVAWRCAAYFPGISLATLLALNVLLVHTGSSGAIPLGAFFSLIALWFLISIPLAFSGGLMATKQEVRPYPTRTNQIPRHIPPPHWASHPAVLFLAAGLLPFGTIFVELYFAMTSIWQGYFYYIFGFCFLVTILTVLITIEVSIVCTYVQLCAEDYLWWWHSFYRGGSVAFYIGLYSVSFLFSTLHALNGIVSVCLYLAYTALMLWAMFLAMGTVGFLASLLFTYQIFAAVKAD